MKKWRDTDEGFTTLLRNTKNTMSKRRHRQLRASRFAERFYGASTLLSQVKNREVEVNYQQQNVALNPSPETDPLGRPQGGISFGTYTDGTARLGAKGWWHYSVIGNADHPLHGQEIEDPRDIYTAPWRDVGTGMG